MIGEPLCLPVKVCNELFLLLSDLKHFNLRKILKIKSYINSLQPGVAFSYPLKTSEQHWAVMG